MKITSCCGCCSVLTGILILGIINIISGLFLFLGTIITYSNGRVFMPVHAVIYLVFGISLLFGAKNRKSKFIFPTLCFYFVNIVLLIPDNFLHEIRLAVITNMGIAIYISITIVAIIILAFQIYSFMVVHTFYADLLREEYITALMNPNVDLMASNQSPQ